MSNSAIRYQSGQAMSEFIVAMALFLPLFLGVIYIGKYADIKHQAIQASRYAAFEQALDPRSQHESANGASVLIEETKARFFTDASRNNGKIGYQDTTSGLTASGTLNPLWSEVNGTSMITNYSDVSVQFPQTSINSSWLSATNTAGNTLFSLNGGGQVRADVEVSVADIAHFLPLSNLNLKIGATTVVAGDSWNAGGAADVSGHFTPLAIPASIFKPLTAPLSVLFQMLSDTNGPQWGCVSPDAVPQDHLSQYNQPAPCSN